ncbi:rho-related GTP-binding protein RhoQ-like [Mercenaria mercenaria]|uniref:rho-related GTP-binding protein RhoQ-like n=1 Tax=Mercenaria mercenaria TaxID=6596 RepID=UPI00234ECC86|nr:rho-related GTP-binding protein RhoQ-like [Mercenaria mercenaria]
MESNKVKERIVRCSIVGDSFVGKTTLIKQFLGEERTDRPTPTVFDNFAGNIHTEDGFYTVSIFDTTGQHDMDGLRHFPYAQSDTIIVCYSVIDRASFNNVLQVWIPEIKEYTLKGTQIVLVATHCDLIDIKSEAGIRSEGMSLAKKIGAFRFVEASMYDFESTSALFEAIVMKIVKRE